MTVPSTPPRVELQFPPCKPTSTGGDHNAPRQTQENDNASKAELIRQTAKALPKPIRPRDIIAALKEKGVEVSYPQITSALKAGGFHRRRRRKGVGTASPSADYERFESRRLLAAKALIQKVGKR